MEKIKIRRRIHGTLSVAQQRRMKKLRALIAEELPELVRRNQLAHTARMEKSLSGVLRRAVHRSPLSPQKIAVKAGVGWADLDDFLTGEKALPSDALDRIARVVKLKLPTDRPKSRRAKAG